MARPLSIEYPGAWYHVMNRGRRGEEIFSHKKDYEAFVVLLRETGEMFDFQVSAYCLMRTEHLMSQYWTTATQYYGLQMASFYLK